MTTATTESPSLLERVAALEEAVKHLASKEDLERVRAELLLAIERVHTNSDRAQARHIRWTVGTIIATGALAVAAIKLL